MPRGVKFTLSLPTGPARDAMRLLREVGEDQRELLNRIGDRLANSTRERIVITNRSPGGVPWKPSKRALRDGGKTLYDKKNLANSVTHEVQGPHRVMVGVDGRSESAKNAAALNFGSNASTVVVTHLRTIRSAFGVPLKQARVVRVRGHPRKMNLPARQFLGIDAFDRIDIDDIAEAYMREKFK